MTLSRAEPAGEPRRVRAQRRYAATVSAEAHGQCWISRKATLPSAPDRDAPATVPLVVQLATVRDIRGERSCCLDAVVAALVKQLRKLVAIAVPRNRFGR